MTLRGLELSRLTHTGVVRESDLFLIKKLTIMKADSKSLIYTRGKLVSKYRHMNKSTLRFFIRK